MAGRGRVKQMGVMYVETQACVLFCMLCVYTAINVSTTPV